MKYELTEYVKTAISEREIPLEWMDRVLANPNRIEPDTQDDNLEHRLGVIHEYDGRVLRVIINKATDPVRVVTAYFDRAMRNRI
ncbi:MAG: DUF4258 domain-containing protein [Planctomycetota bacterium]|jgi:hypothetical protein